MVKNLQMLKNYHRLFARYWYTYIMCINILAIAAYFYGIILKY